MISQSIKKQIIDQTNIVEVVGEVAKENANRGRSESELTVSEVISRVEKTKDGSLKVKESDGSVKATISDGSRAISGKMPLNKAQLETLQQYMQVTRASKPPAEGISHHQDFPSASV